MKKAQFTKPLTIALSQSIFEEIKQITDDRQISMAEWVREAVDAALEEHKKQDPLRF